MYVHSALWVILPLALCLNHIPSSLHQVLHSLYVNSSESNHYYTSLSLCHSQRKSKEKCSTNTQIKNMHIPILVFALFATTKILITPSTSATDYSFIFAGCSQLRYTPGSPYESNVNSILSSLVNSAMMANYNKFTAPGSTPQDTVYGLYQCAGNFQTDQCAACVARAVSQLGTTCSDACGGALQLDGCSVKYDNITFLGVEDKTVVWKRCGPPIGYNSDALTRKDAVLTYLGSSDTANKMYGISSSEDVSGVVQCTEDLSASECQDCLNDAIGRLRTDCSDASYGDVFLGKCYVRYSIGGAHSGAQNGKDDDHNHSDTDKTLAILIGLIVGVAILIVVLSSLSRL